MLGDILLILFAYGLGSVSCGLLLARLHGGVDLRQSGSGNIGATNVARAMGKGAGIVALVGDCAKGVIPVLLVRRGAVRFSLRPLWRWRRCSAIYFPGTLVFAAAKAWPRRSAYSFLPCLCP